MKFAFSFLMSLGALCAADVSISQSDFVERFVNFVIFFSILWYLGADKIKGIFAQRTQRISDRLEEIQENEKSLKRQLQEAESALADARVKSAEIIANAKREAFLIAQQFDVRLEQDVKVMNDSFEELLKQEKLKILVTEVSSAIDHVSESLHISGDSYVKILTEGVKR